LCVVDLPGGMGEAAFPSAGHADAFFMVWRHLLPGFRDPAVAGAEAWQGGEREAFRASPPPPPHTDVVHGALADKLRARRARAAAEEEARGGRRWGVVRYPYVRLSGMRSFDVERVDDAVLGEGAAGAVAVALAGLCEALAGLAAAHGAAAGPMVGAPVWVVAARRNEGGVVVLVNPEVVEVGPERERGAGSGADDDGETCPCLPGLVFPRAHVLGRRAWVRLRWRTPGMEGVQDGVFRGEEAVHVQRGLDYLGGGLVLDRLDPTFLYSPSGAAVGRAVRAWEANAWAWGALGTHRASLAGVLDGEDAGVQDALLDGAPPPALASSFPMWLRESAAALGAPQMERSMAFAAYHEAGHAIVAALLPTSSVGEGGVTVVVSEGRLGGTEVEHWSDPEEDPMSVVHELAVLLAGMAAEERFFGRCDAAPGPCLGLVQDLVEVACLVHDHDALLREALHTNIPAGYFDEPSTFSRRMGLPHLGCYLGVAAGSKLMAVDCAYTIARDLLRRFPKSHHAIAGRLLSRGHVTDDEVYALLNEENGTA